jgi:hypothetical protein
VDECKARISELGLNGQSFPSALLNCFNLHLAENPPRPNLPGLGRSIPRQEVGLALSNTVSEGIDSEVQQATRELQGVFF